MAGLKENLSTWKSAPESKGLRANLMKTKVLVCKIGQINVKPSRKKNPCSICVRKTMANAVICKSGGKWIHATCAKSKKVTNRLAIDLKCMKCKGCHKNVEDQEEKLHDDVETVTDYSYLGDGINSGGCEAAVTSKTRLG